MDTRRKIVSEAELGPVTKRTRAWAGYFDPLFAAHARRLGEIVREGEQLIAVVANPPDPVLPLRARAELLAAFAPICQVIEAGCDIDEILSRFPADSIIDDRAADMDRRRDLLAHVVQRQSGTSSPR